MESKARANYETRIVPALRQIQKEFTYLAPDALKRFSKESKIPLYRLQAVASFFPHFRLTEPPAVTVSVCRDMACHMKGSAQTIAHLEKVAGDRVCVEGVSCVGRCDRATAACVTTHKSGDEHYYLGRSAAELEKIVNSCVAGTPPSADHDSDLPGPAKPWKINPYRAPSDYQAVRRVAAARLESIRKASEVLVAKQKFSAARAEDFRAVATMGGNIEFGDDPQLRQVHDAVCDWQTEDDWAKGPDLGGWADPFLAELDDKHADLRGLGGAGIPATTKWRDVRDAVRTARRRRADDRAFIVVNGDESEPATFKDRELLMRAPHLVIEAVILAGLITEATEGFIYIRHEFHEQIHACEQEIARAAKAGVCSQNTETASVLGRPFKVSVFVSPGGYICGEQSALIEAMSDRRGEPRNMPPKLETNGLDNQPTLVSNVETYAWVPAILLLGGEKYAARGTNTWRGRRFFSVCGDVKRPGVYEVPMGMTLRELIEGAEYCQGVSGGRKLKAFAPSGPSGGFLPARIPAKGLPRDYTKNKSWLELAARRKFDPAATELDILDLELELNLFRALSPTGCLGAGLAVYAEGRDMVAEALNSLEFYRNESCGKCVPCRIGSQKMVALGTNLLDGRIKADQWEKKVLPLVTELCKTIEQTSICGLGRSVPVPLRTVIEFFPDDLERYLKP